MKEIAKSDARQTAGEVASREISDWTALIQVRVREAEASKALDSAVKKLAEVSGRASALDGLIEQAQKSVREAQGASEKAIQDAKKVEKTVEASQKDAEATKNKIDSLGNLASKSADDTLRINTQLRETEGVIKAAQQIAATGDSIVNATIANTEFQKLVADKVASPTGIIVASTVACSALGSGWAEFTDGAGRFIVGVGRGPATPSAEVFVVNDIGGEYRHKLTEPELPSHVHDLGMHRIGNEYPGHGIGRDPAFKDRIMVEWVGIRDVASLNSKPTGSNQPHPIMPPYIALHWCKKS